MRKIFVASAAALAAAATPMIAAAESAANAIPTVRSGTQIYGADGHRIGNAYNVQRSGEVLIILDGKMAYIPASTLSLVNGKVTTTLTRDQLSKTR